MEPMPSLPPIFFCFVPLGKHTISIYLMHGSLQLFQIIENLSILKPCSDHDKENARATMTFVGTTQYTTSTTKQISNTNDAKYDACVLNIFGTMMTRLKETIQLYLSSCININTSCTCPCSPSHFNIFYPILLFSCTHKHACKNL
jgi:hypothetical protein